MTVTIAGVAFDRVTYDDDVDVLYLWDGEPRSPASDDGSPEGHYLQYGEDGALIALTIVNARRILERDGRITITLPERQIEAPADEVGAALAAA